MIIKDRIQGLCFVILCTAFLASASVSVELKELAHFVVQFYHNPAQVGAVAPCTAAVGTELTKYVAQFQKEHPNKPLHILEVGAGTGPITVVIAEKLRPNDTFDAVEISPEFCDVLHKKIDGKYKVNIQCASILDWEPDYQYDIIISTLPFTSLPLDLMSDVLDHMHSLIKSDGVFSYVAYAGIAKVKKSLLWGQKKCEHVIKMEILDQFRERYEIDTKLIFLNVPPIHVYHLRIR